MHARMLAAYLLLCTHCALAGESAKASDLMSEDDYLGDVPKVLTVSRLSQPLSDAPSAVTIIDRETIRASGVVDLPDIFRLVPGFYVGSNAGYFQSVNAAVSYHGMTDAYSRRMQVMIDGRTVYEPLYGGVQWSDLPLALTDIERIEVTRGPNAASYGANSFLGVINIITQHPSEVEGSSVSLTHGNGRNEAFYRYGGKTDDLSYRITTGYREDDGLQNRNDFKRTEMISARADYRASDKDELEFQFGYNGGAREEGIEDSLLLLPRTKDVYSHFQLVRWRRTLSEDSDFSIQAYHSFDQSDDQLVSSDLTTLLAPLPLVKPRLYIQNDVQNERFDLEAQHTFSPLQSLRLVWGSNLRLDRTYAPLLLGTTKTDTFHLARLFGQLEWHPLAHLVLNAGAMIENNDLTGTDVTPRFSANFKLAPQQTVRIGISTATRTPTYLEDKFNTRIFVPSLIPGRTFFIDRYRDTGGLAPERILSREIGYLGTFGTLSIDARLFDDSMSDLIRAVKAPPYAVPAGFTRIPLTTGDFINDGSARVRGYETQIQWRMSGGTRLIANYAYVRITGEKSELDKNFLDSMPTTTISALLSHQFNAHWDGSLAYYETTAVAALGDGDPVGYAQHWDARLARSFESGRWRGEISGAVQNLFNSQYQEFAEYNVMSRRAYVNLKLDF
jgi:iron complex outermembrane receptor protein